MQVRRVFVSPELIATMLTTGYTLKGELTVSEGVPEGSILTAIGWDVATRSWALDFSYQAFEWVPEGKAPEVLSIVIQKKNAVLADALSE